MEIKKKAWMTLKLFDEWIISQDNECLKKIEEF